MLKKYLFLAILFSTSLFAIGGLEELSQKANYLKEIAKTETSTKLAETTLNLIDELETTNEEIRVAEESNYLSEFKKLNSEVIKKSEEHGYKTLHSFFSSTYIQIFETEELSSNSSVLIEKLTSISNTLNKVTETLMRVGIDSTHKKYYLETTTFLKKIAGNLKEKFENKVKIKKIIADLEEAKLSITAATRSEETITEKIQRNREPLQAGVIMLTLFALAIAVFHKTKKAKTSTVTDTLLSNTVPLSNTTYHFDLGDIDKFIQNYVHKVANEAGKPIKRMKNCKTFIELTKMVANEPCLILDSKSKIIWANEQYKMVFADFALSSDSWNTLSQHALSHEFDPVFTTMKLGGENQATYFFELFHQRFQFKVTAYPFESGSQKIYLVTMNEIIEEVKVEEAPVAV